MNSQPSILGDLAIYFAALSLIAVGGAGAVMPDMYRHAVDAQGWMTADDFATLVALSQAAPGPNVLIVALLGWKVGGLPGGVVATVGMCLPSSMLAFHFAAAWQGLRGTPVYETAQAVLVPAAVGLILASGYVLIRSADHGLAAYAITGATILLAVKTRIHPLWLLGAAGVLGGAGLV